MIGIRVGETAQELEKSIIMQRDTPFMEDLGYICPYGKGTESVYVLTMQCLS